MEHSVGFAFAPQLALKHSPAKLNTITNTLSPRAKRKRTSDDVDMESNTQQEHIEPTGKRIRALPIGRPLPLSRLLDDLDKRGLQDLLKSLCERHPGLSNEVYKHAPKPSVIQAVASLSKFERAIQAAFPFGGNPRGEYAYNRVLPAIRELLEALTDYVPHFLPPNEEHATETLNFLDAATGFIARLPDWENENHALLKREAFEELNGAWLQGLKEASKKGAGVGAATYLQKLRHWNEMSSGQFEDAVQMAKQELSWLDGQRCHPDVQESPLRTSLPRGLFSQ